MKFKEADPLPKACQQCKEVKECVSRGEGEWCCEECDHLGERFYVVDSEAENEKNGKRNDFLLPLHPRKG